MWELNVLKADAQATSLNENPEKDVFFMGVVNIQTVILWRGKNRWLTDALSVVIIILRYRIQKYMVIF